MNHQASQWYTQLSFSEVPWIHCLAIEKLELLSLSYTNYLDFTGDTSSSLHLSSKSSFWKTASLLSMPATFSYDDVRLSRTDRDLVHNPVVFISIYLKVNRILWTMSLLFSLACSFNVSDHWSSLNPQHPLLPSWIPISALSSHTSREILCESGPRGVLKLLDSIMSYQLYLAMRIIHDSE